MVNKPYVKSNLITLLFDVIHGPPRVASWQLDR